MLLGREARVEDWAGGGGRGGGGGRPMMSWLANLLSSPATNARVQVRVLAGA